MKNIAILFLAGCLIGTTFGQYNDPNFPVPASGYGSNGTHTVGVISFANAYFPGEDIKIYHPSDIATAVPTLFYSHAYGGNFPSHVLGLLTFVAKKGYAIVFVPYQTVGVSVDNRYENLLAGFRKAARDYPAIIDTTQVGFMGHSFGGGASIGIAYACITENGWGSNGRYIHPSAPWYSYRISQSELQSFPSDTKLLMEVYDDDVVNDHRMAVDIFNTINIPASEKDFILVRSDTVGGYVYTAGHDLPTNYSSFDAFDYYAYYRLIDALCDYTFHGNLAGKNVALGNGSADQITMPSGMKNLVQTDTPSPAYPESKYGFACSSFGNPRNMYCPTILDIVPDQVADQLRIYPNPFTSTLEITNLTGGETITLFNKWGQVLYRGNDPAAQDFSLLPADMYFISIRRSGFFTTSKVVKQ